MANQYMFFVPVHTGMDYRSGAVVVLSGIPRRRGKKIEREPRRAQNDARKKIPGISRSGPGQLLYLCQRKQENREEVGAIRAERRSGGG